VKRGRRRLAARLMAAQAAVVGLGTLTLVLTALLVAPGLFHGHLESVGVPSGALEHAEDAFASSFAISVAVATTVGLISAGLVSWLLVRRVSRPVEELAQAARSVAAGQYDVSVPDATFSSELHELSESFTYMAHRLSESESVRIRLLADLAHELRTPLATLEGYIDGMEDGVLPSDAASWETMRDQVERLRRLSIDLREAAAAEEHALGLTLQHVDARDVVAGAVAAASPRFHAKGVDLRMGQGLRPCPILADTVRLQQVLANLLDNSLRHTSPAGTVTVTAGITGTSVTMTVTDTGEGIPIDQLSSVFERFHRVDPSRVTADGSGSGLGLTIARAIVVDHGGSLDAASAGAGQGTMMRISLPAAPRT
jgi:signal transduction histidine kinase